MKKCLFHVTTLSLVLLLMVIFFPLSALAAPTADAPQTATFLTGLDQLDQNGKLLESNIRTYYPAKGQLGLRLSYERAAASSYYIKIVSEGTGATLVPRTIAENTMALSIPTTSAKDKYNVIFTKRTGISNGYGSVSFVETNYTSPLSFTIADVSTTPVAPIKPVVPKVTSIKLDTASLHLAIGRSATIQIKSILPAKASKKVKWSSSDTSIATVNANGQIKALKKGTVRITATAADGSGKKAAATVRVWPKSASLSCNKKTLSLKTGRSFTVKSTVKPKTAYQGVVYKSSNPTAATVSASGKVLAKAPGKTTITVTSKDGLNRKTTIQVTVS